jgi:ABC-type antimicrobial peptide transport system ATPase subunit
MDEGAIVEQGTPADVFSQPREARTQRFLEHFTISHAKAGP